MKPILYSVNTSIQIVVPENQRFIYFLIEEAFSPIFATMEAIISGDFFAILPSFFFGISTFFSNMHVDTVFMLNQGFCREISSFLRQNPRYANINI